MTRISLGTVLSIWFLCALCAGCSHGASDDDDAAKPDGSVLVTVVPPVQQTFHSTVQAWGSAVGDPRQARAISLAYGGQVAALAVTAGQTVARGQALLTIKPDPAVRSVYQQAQTALTLARGDLARIGQLATQRLATQSQLATARKALADAQATLDAQRAQGGGAAEETVTAPTAGVVTALGVHLGERFAAGAPLLNFTPAHALVADLGVQPEDGARLHVGMAVQLRSVYGDQPDFVGRLRMIGQSIDPQTHLLDAQVELPAAASATLMAGAALDAQIRTADFTAWAVPRAAVLRDEHGAYLFQVEHGHAKRIAVRLRSPDGDTVGVVGAIDAQAPVIVLGAYELDDGGAVEERGAATTPGSIPAASTAPMKPAASASVASTPGESR